MAEVNKISSFKSFTEVKNQETAMKLREENNAKRQETVGKIGEILDEMGVTSLTELEEDTKQALISKMFGNVSEDEAEDIEDEINKLGEPKKLEEGNAFVYAAGKAKAEGKDEFEFNGKTYKVTIKDTGVKESIEEGNAFGDAVRKAKEAGESEFEFEGETYKVEEHLDEAISRSAFDRMDGLHNTKAMDALLKSAEIIFKDLYDEMFEFDEIVDFITMTLKKSKLAKMFETVVTEGKHGMAKKLLKGIVDGDSTDAEGIKMSKELADHYLSWIETSPYGKRNENLPLYMLVNASFNWGIERGLPKELKKELDTLKNNVKESVEVNEAEIKSDDEFKEYAMSVLKKAFGTDFDEAKAGEVADGILKKCDGDYGACVGMLTGSLGESVTNEATIELDATDPKDKNLAKLLKKHKVSIEVINKKGPSGYPEVKLTGDVKGLKAVLADDEYGWDDEDLAEYIEESTDSNEEISHES